ncbi:hypothetical protein AHAS_Ahas18G0079800 [Arachis hypogaea]
MTNKSDQDVLSAAEALHGESNNIPFLEHLLDDLNKNGIEGEAYKDALDLSNRLGILPDKAALCDAAEPWQLGFQDAANYNSSDEQSLTFDSYTIPEDDLELGQSRLLEVDNRVVVPAKTHLRIIVTPADVPHSWAVPSLGVKCDAVPGRLNQISISVQREGVYYGQCSEIYGTNHAFTPIVVEAVPSKDYGLDFSAMIFPVVHIGAIAVSFLFVVMMFHIQIAEIHEEVLRYLPVSGIIGLIL